MSQEESGNEERKGRGKGKAEVGNGGKRERAPSPQEQSGSKSIGGDSDEDMADVPHSTVQAGIGAPPRSDACDDQQLSELLLSGFFDPDSSSPAKFQTVQKRRKKGIAQASALSGDDDGDPLGLDSESPSPPSSLPNQPRNHTPERPTGNFYEDLADEEEDKIVTPPDSSDSTPPRSPPRKPVARKNRSSKNRDSGKNTKKPAQKEKPLVQVDKQAVSQYTSKVKALHKAIRGYTEIDPQAVILQLQNYFDNVVYVADPSYATHLALVQEFMDLGPEGTKQRLSDLAAETEGSLGSSFGGQSGRRSSRLAKQLPPTPPTPPSSQSPPLSHQSSPPPAPPPPMAQLSSHPSSLPSPPPLSLPPPARHPPTSALPPPSSPAPPLSSTSPPAVHRDQVRSLLDFFSVSGRSQPIPALPPEGAGSRPTLNTPPTPRPLAQAASSHPSSMTSNSTPTTPATTTAPATPARERERERERGGERGGEGEREDVGKRERGRGRGSGGGRGGEGERERVREVERDGGREREREREIPPPSQPQLSAPRQQHPTASSAATGDPSPSSNVQR